MNFSEPLKSQNGQVAWSDDGLLLASASGVRLMVWDAASLDVLQVYTTTNTIDKIEFSPDCEFILAASYKQGETCVFGVNEPDWSGRITEGVSGLVNATWTADSRHIITTAEFNLKLTIWSLASKSVYYIRNPKPVLKPVQYNKDSSLAAVAERQGCRDIINIFSTDDWSLVKQFEADTADLAGLLWCPARDCLAVWDSTLAYRLQVFSLDGRTELDYSAYEHQLGVKVVAWSPSGALLAVASCDNKMRIFESLAWGLVLEIDHMASLHEDDPVSCRANIYQEEDLPMVDIDARLAIELGGMLLQQSKYRLINERPIYLDFSKPDPRKPGNVRVGPGAVEWSHCGRYLASKCDNLGSVVWVWDMVSLQLAAILVHKETVKHIRWDPTQPRLSVVCGGPALYFWTPLGSLVGRIPPVCRGEMAGVTEIRWNPRGRALALSNKEQTVLCRLQKDGAAGGKGGGGGVGGGAGCPNDDLDLEPSRESDSCA